MRKLHLSVIVASLLAPAVALADTGPTARFHSMLQQGQDVEITVAIPDDGYLLVGDPHRLTRERNGAVVTLFEEMVFAESVDAVQSFVNVCVTSYDPDAVDCAEAPDECTDCDGDGTPECGPSDYCDYYALFDVVDTCVPAGEATYRIQNEVQEYSQGAQAIEVIDSGEPCGGSAGCAVASPGRAAAPSVLALLMLGAGLALVGRGRR
jgi:hypothetical protein